MGVNSDVFVSNLLKAWSGGLSLTELLGYSEQLQVEVSGRPLAIILFQTWLNRTQSPYAHAVWFNLGAALANEMDLSGAMNAYRQALALSPTFAQPRINLGLLYERQGAIDKALEEWRWIEQNISCESADNKSMVLLALGHMGRMLEGAKRNDEAISCLAKSLRMDPNQPDVIHHLVFLRERQCEWPIYSPIEGVSDDLMRHSTSVLAMLNVTDDPAIQLESARRYVANKVTLDVPVLSDRKEYGHSRIRIAYCSSDFTMHPVSMLMAELFELHDRTQFEVYGFCWSPEDGSAMRQRVIKAMDHFVRIDQLSDEAAARLIRENEIDVLVDLQGQTSGARANILAYRPAPIQITYLGLPATTGFPFIDYVIADKFLIPEKYAQYYSEKPLYMPDVYQVSDRNRKAGSKPSRESCGLPDDAFVFCVFNNNYKYTPEMFKVWMNILRRTQGSVLWLLSDNETVQRRLISEAETQGVEKKRLVFASRVSPENYLARYMIADLFLDTFPFNAGTTANDALWMGLPVLTLTGRAFASRMAGALLTAAKIDELITCSFQDYEEKAVYLATHPGECQRIRELLKEAREHGVLFDTPLFVKNLEDKLKHLVKAQKTLPE